MAKFTSKIVGMFYRKPAQGILDGLPINFPLHLKREPENQFDRKAVAIFLFTKDLVNNEDVQAQLSEELQSFGYTIEDIMSKEVWHLGYVPKNSAPDWVYVLDPDLYINVFFRIIDGKPGFATSDFGVASDE
jgi:type II secretory pathway component PulJ